MRKSTRRSRIPKFRSEADEARFWDTHDTTDFLSEFHPATLKFRRAGPKRLVSIRIAQPHIELLRRLAARKGLGCGSLIRMWITERLQYELRPAKR